MYLCGFVCCDVCCRANNVAGTIRWCLRTNEISQSKHDIAALKVKQGHFETAILILDNFVVFHHNWMCWKTSYLNIFITETSSAVMQLCKGSYFNVAPGSRHLWPYSDNNTGGLKTVLKISHLPWKLRFSGKCVFLGQPLSPEHFPAIFQPPGDV